VESAPLIAIAGARFAQLRVSTQAQLAATVRAGATLYIRGIADGAATNARDRLLPSSIRVAPKADACTYRFGTSALVPSVLRGEAANALIAVSGAESLPSNAEVLLSVRHLDGVERAVIFALRHGHGRVIYDLHADFDGSEYPIIARLADPRTRPAEVGALIAVNQVGSNVGEQPAPFNLTIDDRPAGHDYFNTESMKRLLGHISELCPQAHTDFAWTPGYTRPPRAYIDQIKRAACGFVWHGFVRHVDHAQVADPERDIALGKRAVATIERRFDVRLQPIMIFPFERSAADQLAILRRHGFLASVEQPRPSAGATERIPSHLECSLASRRDERSNFTVLYRYEASSLTHDRLLAMSAIGLPIIAYAHPEQLGLKRLSFIWNRGDRISHFDEILNFASAKGLPSASLEEIALATASDTPGPAGGIA
jgi:hypothetical protein